MIVGRVQEVMSKLEGSRSKVMSGLLGWRAQRLFPGLLDSSWITGRMWHGWLCANSQHLACE